MSLTWMQIVTMLEPRFGADVRLVMLAALCIPPDRPVGSSIAAVLGYTGKSDLECLYAILTRLARLGWTIESGRVVAPVETNEPPCAA